jgi:hypothetical protein
LIIFEALKQFSMKFAGFALFSALLIVNSAVGQSITGRDTTFKVITTAVPFLTISPDARSAGLGDAGVATTPDANSAFWNPGKLAFIDQAYGGSLSYTPWLGKIINDMWISYLTGFYKITREQAIAVSMKYFDLGDISFRSSTNDPLGDFRPREMALDLTYSRMLSEEFGVGVTGRYIYSNLTGAISQSNSGGVDAQAGNGVAVDIGVFYDKQLRSTRNSNLSLGAAISNIGTKITYTDSENKDFLPTNLKLGGVYKTEFDQFNSMSFILDFNKLLVPTIDQGQSVLSGMFQSFTDAPGGAAEEFKEIIVNTGVEYWYSKIFAARVGYFYESREKGNRQYLTLGTGFRKNRFGIDVAYIVPTNQREHPLAETLRFTIFLQVDAKEVATKSVTDQ